MILALALLLQDVTIGDAKIAVKLRAKNGERGPAAMAFEPNTLVAFARNRHIHLYHWSRESSRRVFDVAFIDSNGLVTEVAPLMSEEMQHQDPHRGINKIKGLTSTQEVQYALILKPNSKVKKGQIATVNLAGSAIEELPALVCGDKKIFLEIVATEPDRSRGLTYRPAISKGEGMLFAYPDAKKRPFWMYHTVVSIDVSYVTSDGKLLEINPMKKLRNPDDETLARNTMVPTKVEAHYVLETAIGWLKEAGFKVGDAFELPKELTSIKPEKSPFE